MIGVCVKFYHENYGGMLQAYATTKMLEAHGLEYELIQYGKKRNPVQKIQSLPRIFNGVLLNDKYEAILKQLGKKQHPEFAQNDVTRSREFGKFKERHFTKVSPIFEEYKDLCNGARRYSAVVTGSDQLWSPAGLPTNFYNLMFVPDGVRKISYASSFGVGQIPWYQKKRTKLFLDRLDFISMREKRGSEIVHELTGRKVPTILDPVFMFDQLGWEKLIPVQCETTDKYIFAYFLGADSEHRNAVRSAAKHLGCKIIALRHLDQYVADDEEFGDFAPYDVAPDRFLNLLRGASYVCTDSFHGSCFSIIHEKPFMIFDRYAEEKKYAKNSRIDTLCDNLGLEDRRYRYAEQLAEQLSSKIDYDEVKRKLDKSRIETGMYLDGALRGML